MQINGYRHLEEFLSKSNLSDSANPRLDLVNEHHD
jgi:hypothetical protein